MSTNTVTARELFHGIVGRALEPDLLAGSNMASYRTKDRMYTVFKYLHTKFNHSVNP